MFSTLSLSSLLARIFSPPPPRFRALPRPRHQLNLAAPVRSANDHPYLSLHSRPRSSWSNLINFVSAPKEDRVRISKEALESLKKYDAAASASKLDTAATNVIVGPNNPANTFAKRARIRTERRASRGQNTLPRGEDGRLNLRVTAPKYTIISSTASHQTLNDARSGGKSVRDQIPPNVFNQPSRATNKTSYPAENSARKSEAAVGLTQSAPPALGSTPELNVEGRSSSQASTSKRVVLEESPSYRGESVELEPLPISDQRTAPTTTILGPRRSTTRVESASVRNGPNVGSERIEQRVDPARAPVQTKETTISPSESVKTESVPLETSHDLRVEDQIAHFAFLEALYSRRPQIHWMVNPSFGITSHFLPPHSQITRRATLHSSHLRDVDQIAWYRARQDALRPPSQSILDARKSADAKLDRAHKLDLRRLEGKESIIEEQTVNLRIEQLDGFVRSLRTVRDEASVFHMSTVRPVEEETRLASELDRLVAAFTHVRDQPPTFPISGTPPSSVTIGAKEPVKALLFADADCTKPYYVPFSKLCQARPAGPSKRDLDEKRRVASRKEKEILLSLAQIAGQRWRRPQV